MKIGENSQLDKKVCNLIYIIKECHLVAVVGWERGIWSYLWVFNVGGWD